MGDSTFLLLCFFTLPIFSNSLDFFSLNTISNLTNGFKGTVKPKSNNVVQKNVELEDAFLNITELVTKYDYKIEEHTVVTEDGYILNIQRMPARNWTKRIILLMHGLMDSSDSWVLQGPENSLAYFLVKEGFDVWMGNARGNKYSSSHVILDKTKSDYWKFSWDEIGFYDLPAMIDYILNLMGMDNLYYVGHSQGTTSFYVMNSLKPEYNSRVKMMFSLAPVSWMSHAKSPILKLLTPAYGILGYLSSIDTYSSSTDYLNKMQKFFCNILPIGCDNLLQPIIGNDNNLVQKSLMPVIFGHVPSSSSTLQLIHYGQLYTSGRFCRFDYGVSENLVRYAQEVPPDYNLRNITVPIVFFYSSNDWLSDVTDVSLLYNELPNVLNTYFLETFNHFDYMYAKIAKDLIYSNIVKEICEFESDDDYNK